MAEKRKRSIESRVEQVAPVVKSQITKEAYKKEKKRISTRFLSVLSIVSILGFFGVAMKTLFENDITSYVEVAWIVTLGLGLVLEANLKSLFRIKKTGLTSDKFSKLVTAVIGFMAILTGILLLPQIGLITPALLAIQGVISIIAIIFILIESWVLKE